MFLKSLEIRGFKSFADKTELVFKKGITAIVGPNGSGKSNISDAVKWVLGEQSVKNLRGGKMQDVIFSGTEYRKQVGLAQVSLVLDNSDGELSIDYNEVIIMRRIYRSGESEYLINNTKCRLRDIQELFMDTGIGKEGYSIIGQGKIEAVLSGKPEERRSLLEEAAGIVKFKTRKEEAERRLENTEQNLQRINDIFSTYEDRIEPLKKENEKAKLFLEISQKLKAKEVTLILNNIDNLDNKLNNLTNEINENDHVIKEILTEKDIYNKKIESLKIELEQFELENSEERKKYYESKSDHQRLLSEIDLLNERVKNLSNNILKSVKNKEQLEEKIEETINERKNHSFKLKELEREQESLNKNIELNNILINEKNKFIDDEINKIKELKKGQVELISEITRYKSEITIITKDVYNMEKKLEELKEYRKTYLNSIKINASTKEMLKDEIININNKINKHEEIIRQNRIDVMNKTHVILDSEAKAKKISIMYNKAEASKDALTNLEKYHEGYNKAVKIIMQNIDQRKIPKAFNNTWILGEIIQVKKEFEIAIEVALGSAISNIITSDEDIAKDLIKHLKVNNLGRATFLPLTIIKGKKISVPLNIKNIDGYIGIASEIIDIDTKYVAAVEYTLGRTIISKDMESALTIAKHSSYNYKIVTLTGEVINPGGALTGGSLHNKNVNIIGRKREIEELKLSIKIYEKEINDLTKQIDDIKESVTNIDNASLKLKDQIHYENIERTKIDEKIIALNSETEKLKRSIEVSNSEETIISEMIRKNIKDLDDLKHKVCTLEKEEEENSSEILNFETNLEKENRDINDTVNKITELKVKKAQIDESVSNKNKELIRFNSEIYQLNHQVKTFEEEVDESNIQITKCRNNIVNNEENVKKIESAIEEFENKFKEIELRIIKVKENIKINTEKLEEILLLYDKNNRIKNNLHISSARFEAERESMYSKLNEEMELTYAEALELRVQEDIDKCKKDIAKYKSQITQLGTINLGAIEEYKELLEKYNFMKAQKDDLVKAKEELLNVVKNMTDKMRTVFNENFNKLKVNFNETFRELFKGGNADLIIEEGDELTANIEINVQPPGKKLQNINLMSGGEKGLSAIALLFAILKMKPTPFCILDEIEAALDDSNVTRYAEFLKRFSINTQFIIITHRKGTMEAGDVLYGITMEEKGVSKIVSVDLEK